MTKTETALAAAMAKAGVKTAEAELYVIAAKHLAANDAGKFKHDIARNARLRDALCDHYLREVRADMARKADSGHGKVDIQSAHAAVDERGGDHGRHDIQTTAVAAATEPPASGHGLNDIHGAAARGGRADEGQPRRDIQRRPAPVRPPQKPRTPEARRAALAHGVEIAKLTLFDSRLIDGTRVGDLWSDDLARLEGQTGRDYWLVTQISAYHRNKFSPTQNLKVRDFLPLPELERMNQRAAAASDAAKEISHGI